MAETHGGACLCGAVEIEVEGEPEAMGYCHCRSCRSYAGAPVIAFTLWQKDRVRVTGGEDVPGRHHQTEFSGRRFCTRCGGHVLVEHPTLGMVDVHAATIPDFPFRPAVHLHYAESVLPMKDGLPKLRDFPAEVGGSGESMPE